MGRFRIDRADERDIPQLVLLLGDLFDLEQDFAPDPQRQAAGLGLLLARPQQAALFVARDLHGTVAGMVSAQCVVSTSQGALSAWLEDLVVAQDQRRCGLGRGLLEAALGWARHKGATRAQLLVDRTNGPALVFYEKLGWQTTQLAARRIFLKRENTWSAKDALRRRGRRNSAFSANQSKKGAKKTGAARAPVRLHTGWRITCGMRFRRAR